MIGYSKAYQPNEPEPPVPVDEDFVSLAIFSEELSEVLLCNVCREIAYKQSAPLCKCFLSRFPEALQVQSHFPRIAAAFWFWLRACDFRRWRRSLHLLHALRGRRLRVATRILGLRRWRTVLNGYMLKVSVRHISCGLL